MGVVIGRVLRSAHGHDLRSAFTAPEARRNRVRRAPKCRSPRNRRAPNAPVRPCPARSRRRRSPRSIRAGRPRSRTVRRSTPRWRRNTSRATHGTTSTGRRPLALAWLSVELLGRLPGGLIRPPPVDIGRFRYRSGFVVARRSAEDLPPFRAPELAVRDTALSLNLQSRNLRPARNPNLYASFGSTAADVCRASSNPLKLLHFLTAGHRTPASPSSHRKRPNSNL